MASKKSYIILLGIIVVFGIIMFLLFGVENIKQENIEGVFIVGDNTMWVHQKKTWTYLQYNSLMEQYNWQKFHVFEDNQYKGDFYLWHDDKWYAFNDQKEAVNINGKFFAYDSNVSLNFYDFQESKIDDFTYVNTVLKENGISTKSKFSSSYKVSLDYDGDSILEDFYIISNALPLDFQPDVTFSIAFMVKDGTIYSIYNDVSSNQGLNGCKPYYHTFIDTNADGVSEIILSCGQFSANDQIDMLYQFIDGSFNLIISNQ